MALSAEVLVEVLCDDSDDITLAARGFLLFAAENLIDHRRCFLDLLFRAGLDEDVEFLVYVVIDAFQAVTRAFPLDADLASGVCFELLVRRAFHTDHLLF